MKSSLSYFKVKYLVLSMLETVSPSAPTSKGLDTGDIYSRVGFATSYLSLVTLMGRWVKQGVIARHPVKREYARTVYMYFLNLSGEDWLKRQKKKLPVADWTAAAKSYSWSSYWMLKRKTFRSIIERCKTIDQAHEARAASMAAFRKPHNIVG